MTQEIKTEAEKTPEERIAALEEAIGTMLDMLEEITKKVAEVDKKAVKKSTGLFGGKRKKTAIKDTKTGIIYPSKARLGKELAGKEDFAGLDPGNNFVYYQIIAKAPDRFIDATDEEAEKAWASEKAEAEKARAAAQVKLDAEAKAAEAAKATAAPEAKTKAPAKK